MDTKLQPLKPVNFVSFGNFSRIELQVNIKVRGGWGGEVPNLVYYVTAVGMLNPQGEGNEGAFFGRLRLVA